jgi:Xaa-Pro dipeptidase
MCCSATCDSEHGEESASEASTDDWLHHAGHGLGLDPQEPPWIIPGSDHIIEVGGVIAVEPGCYAEALHGGVRLECDYVVRENGLENLSSFPLTL